METVDQNQAQTHPAVPRPRPAEDDLVSRSLTQRIDRPDRDTVVLTLSGVVDSRTAPRLAEILRARLHSQLTRVVLDLSGVGFLGVAGISVLVHADLRAQYTGIMLDIVCDGNRQVERALTVTAQHHHLRWHPGPVTGQPGRLICNRATTATHRHPGPQ